MAGDLPEVRTIGVTGSQNLTGIAPRLHLLITRQIEAARLLTGIVATAALFLENWQDMLLVGRRGFGGDRYACNEPKPETGWDSA